MKINGNEIRPGNVIRHKDSIWVAVKISHVKPGKGAVSYTHLTLPTTTPV